MKNAKKFKFDASHSELLNKSINDFENDTVKSIAANEMVGGLLPPRYFRVIWIKIIVIG